MGKINVAPIDIGIGSDFKIKLLQITDDDGNSLDFNEIYIGVDWMDSGGVKYCTVWNPKGESRNATVVDGELHLIFNRTVHSFRYPGRLRYQIFSQIADSGFIDNVCNVRDKVEISNINLITL